jgi:ubiquitin C-terminal hydrolase/ankyrin repeat protein
MWTTDLCRVAEDQRTIARQNLALSQQFLSAQQEELNQRLSAQQTKCLQLFRLTKSSEDATYEWYKERIAGRVEGTCLWFLNHPHFQEWRRSESGPLLVSADPGCGKSVLAKYLIDHVLAESSIVCYFFFKDQVQNTVREALCALLHQLFSQKRSLLVHAMEQYEKDGAGLVKSTSSLWSVLRAAMQDANAGAVTIVLDALDECAESETRDLLQHMESQIRDSSSRAAKLKLLMTSRPYEHVVSKLHGLSQVFPHIRIPGEDESETISQEVNCVVRHRVDHFAEVRGLSDEIKACLQDQLLRMEHRTYLWVYLVFDYLEDVHFRRTPRGMASTFDALPKSVHQAYEHILSKSKDCATVQKALAIILAATRPLTLSEMSVAMEVDESTKSTDDLDLEREHDFKSRLRSWCGLFVSVYQGRIYFLHQTAREFLLAEQMSSSTIQNEMTWRGFTAMSDAHAVLAECCVRYLNSFSSDASPPTDTTRDASHHVDRHAFLDYSAKFWVVHVREASISNDDAVIAPLASRISDPDSKTYLVWSQLYWKSTYMRIPRFSTALTVASYFGHDVITRQLVDKGADLESKDKSYARTPLSWAAMNGHEAVAEMLLEKGGNVESKDGYSRTALSLAASNGHEAVVKKLLEKGADLESKDKRYARTPLSWAATNGHETVVKKLLEKGADLESKDKSYARTPLSWAATNGHEAVVKKLLEKGANVESKDRYGRTPLSLAATNGHEAVIKKLLEKGADVASKDRDDRTPLLWATTNRHEAVAKLLLVNGADLESKDKVMFAFKGHYRMEKEEVINLGASMSQLDNSAPRTRGTMGLTNLGNTGWMNSAVQCIRSVEELAAYFLQGEYKQDVNAKNPIGHGGAIAKAYARLLAVIYGEEGTTSFAPESFKSILSRANSLFSGYGQRDAQEFLSWFIDAMHEDLNRVRRKPYTENPETDDNTAHNPEAIKVLGDKFRSNHHSRDDSVATDLFLGFSKVNMTCPDCGKVDITFDSYNMITLELPIEQTRQYTVRFVPLRGKIWDVAVIIDENATIKALKEDVGKRFGVKWTHLMASEVYNHKFYRHLNDADTLAESNINQREDIYLYELDGVPSNWPPPRKKNKRTFTSSVWNHDTDDDIPDYMDPHHDRVLTPIFHRAPNTPSCQAQRWSLRLWPSYILIDREEAKDYDTILKKVLGEIAQMTTRQIFAVSSYSPQAQSHTSSGVVFTTEDASPSRDLVEGEDNTVGMTMPEPAKTLVNPSAEDGDDMPDVLRPGNFVPPELRQLFEMKHTRANEEFVTTGWNTIDNNKTYEAISKRIRVPSSSKSCIPSLPPYSIASSTKKENKPQSSAHAQSSIKAATQGRDQEDERLIRMGEAIVLEWTTGAYDALFNGTDVDDQRGMDILRFVEPLEDEEFQAKKAQRAVRQKNGITLEECFAETYKIKVLSQDNAWYCKCCKELRRAAKKLEIWTAPDILLVQLKRFSGHRTFRDKIDVLVDFPIEGLDLTDKVGLPEEKELVYDLFATINHHGGLNGGVNTAFAKNFFDQQWYEYNSTYHRPSYATCADCSQTPPSADVPTSTAS